jgi:hypothetical protein
MSGALAELTRGRLNRERDETDSAALQAAENVATSDSAALAAAETQCRAPVRLREDNEKPLSQL